MAMSFLCFFFSLPPTPGIYTLSLHDALPIYAGVISVAAPLRVDRRLCPARDRGRGRRDPPAEGRGPEVPTRADRKSTRLNSSHRTISYAVFCLKKKKKNNQTKHANTTNNDII